MEAKEVYLHKVVHLYTLYIYVIYGSKVSVFT